MLEKFYELVARDVIFCGDAEKWKALCESKLVDDEWLSSKYQFASSLRKKLGFRNTCLTDIYIE